MSDPEVLAVVPAHATRYADRTLWGQPSVQLVFEAVARSFEHAIVATGERTVAELAVSLGLDVWHSPSANESELSLLTAILGSHIDVEIAAVVPPISSARWVRQLCHAAELLAIDPEADAVELVSRIDGRAWIASSNGTITPTKQRVMAVAIAGAHVVRRQLVLAHRRLVGERPLSLVVDAPPREEGEEPYEQMKRALLDWLVSGTSPKTLCIDIDGVIAASRADIDYARAAPIPSGVRMVNALHDLGHRIVLHTARGTVTGIDWRQSTEQQLLAWGVQYDELQFGKPAADIYIDDRGLNVADAIAELSTHET
jgi:hypothetical protein